MALVSNIVIDLVSRTAILTATVSGDSVDTITYDDSTNTVIFDSRLGIIISFAEFLDFVNQVNIFQTAILFNYNPNVFATVPFAQMITNELHDPGTWSLTVSPHTDPNVVEYAATKSSSKMDIAERSGSKTLEFPEWLYFLIQLNHYKTSVKQF